MMKYGVIDIGSNSVRLMISDGKNNVKKYVKSTRLAEGMGTANLLNKNSVERTVSAVSFFVDKAREEKVNDVFIFATAAVRNATNKSVFTDMVYQKTNIRVDVVSGEQEAFLGRIGALGLKDGGIIDVGGASTEIGVVVSGDCVYSKSINIGAVKVTDQCGQDMCLAQKFIRERINEFGAVPLQNFSGIGGTATSVGAMVLELEPYDPQIIDGYVLKIEDLEIIVDKLYSLSIEERQKLKGLQPDRAKVIANGSLILLELFKHIGINEIKISERDNLEGYLTLKLGEKND